ncbi:MAG: helix-turn-helix domain-containing protein [Leucobacter sp.]
MPDTAQPEALFDEINGVADDIESWQNLIWGSKPEFQKVGMRSGERSFTGSLSRTILDRVSTHRIQAETRNHAVVRTPQHIRHTVEPHYVFMFQLEGRTEFHQRLPQQPLPPRAAGQPQQQTRSMLRPGDFTLTHSGTPYTWLFPEDFEVYMLILPQALIDVPPGALRRLSGSAIRSDGPFGQCLTSFIDAIAYDQEALRSPVGMRAMRSLVDVVSTRVVAEIDATSTDRERPSLALFRRLTDYISQHLGDPELSPATVAQANYISVRYAQAIFQGYDTTITSWVRERRLSRVREDLGDPLHAHRSIGDIAGSWGLVDQASFSRSFRLSFGESPSQWRARADVRTEP